MAARVRIAVVLAALLLVTPCHTADDRLFRADFEDGLRAQGADPPEPSGAAGGGYEVSTRGREHPIGVAIDDAFPAQGGHCLRLADMVQWHVGRQDVIAGRLSLYLMPLSLPWEGERRELIWGGDAAKPYQTLRVEMDHRGRVCFSYYSWQRQQSWLGEITSAEALRPRRWNHLALTWGEHGQRVYINGTLSAQRAESYPLSWLFDLRLGGFGGFVDEVELAPADDAPQVTVPETQWKPTTAGQADMAWIESRTSELLAATPPGTDAHCRAHVISYVSARSWTQALQNPPSALAQDNIRWMKEALQTTVPALRGGERPVPPFDASVPIRVADGRILQGGRPTYLLGLYSPTPVDREIGFSLGNALMPGPSYAFPSPQGVGDDGAGLAAAIDSAEASGRVLDVLVSLNLPEWLSAQDTLIAESGCGWFHFSVEAPSVVPMFHATADVVMQSLMGHGQNLIVNLGNEPAYQGYSPTTTGPRWRAWLMARHRTIGKLNEAWGTAHASFAEVAGPPGVKAGYADCADPGGMEVPTDPALLPQWYDWCRFNQERYAGFFRQVRDRIRDHRPETLFTIKWLSVFPSWWKAIGYALNPYHVMRLCDFGSCDAWTTYAGLDPQSLWAVHWGEFARGYDLLRSIAPDKPIFNSENHLLRGDDPTAPALKYGTYRDALPWRHFNSALWLQAIRGGCAGELWTYWERGKGYNLDERAPALDALSQAARDLRRYAPEVTALAGKRPTVAVLLSSTALAWEPRVHIEAQARAHRALSLLGIPVGYMLEEMLPEGALGRYSVLVIPSAAHISRALVDALGQFASRGGTVIITGSRPSADEYGKPLALTLPFVALPDRGAAGALPDLDDTACRALHRAFRRLLRDRGLTSEVSVRIDGHAAYGIDWRHTQVGGRDVVFICNLLNRSVEAELALRGHPLEATDLVTARKVVRRAKLEPLEVLLLETRR